MFTREVTKLENGNKVPVDNDEAYEKAVKDFQSLIDNDYVSAFDADIGVVLLQLMIAQLDGEQSYRLLYEAATMFKKLGE